MAQMIKATVCVHCMPEEPLKPGYLVARQYITVEHGASLWYYGHFESKERAKRAAIELGNGVLLEVEGEKPVKIRREDEHERV